LGEKPEKDKGPIPWVPTGELTWGVKKGPSGGNHGVPSNKPKPSVKRPKVKWRTVFEPWNPPQKVKIRAQTSLFGGNPGWGYFG